MARKKAQRKRQQKKRQVAKKRVQRQAKRAASDGKVTARETRQLKKIASAAKIKPGAVKRSVKAAVSNRSNNNKSTTIRRQAAKKLDNKKGRTNRTTPLQRILGSDDNNNNSSGNQNNTSSSSQRSSEIDTANELDKFINKDFLDQKAITPQNKISGKKWKPDDIANDVAKQWGSRFKDDNNFKPKELKVNAPNTPDRIKKYTSKGTFDTEKYVSDVRSRMYKRAKQRGLSGDVTSALDRKSPAKITSTKPKYGSAINKLKKQLGKVNYREQIKETTEKLTGSVQPKRRQLQKVGLDLIKPRNSEDGALSPAQIKTANDRFNQATKKNNKIFGQTRQQIKKATEQAKIDKRAKRDARRAKRANERFDQAAETPKVFGKSDKRLRRRARIKQRRKSRLTAGS